MDSGVSQTFRLSRSIHRTCLRIGMMVRNIRDDGVGTYGVDGVAKSLVSVAVDVSSWDGVSQPSWAYVFKLVVC